MNTFSKKLIQAGLPTLALAAAPALADNRPPDCPQPANPPIVGFQHIDSFIQFFTSQFGDAGPNADDLDFNPLNGGGAEVLEIFIATFASGGTQSWDLVVSAADGVGTPNLCGTPPPGTELLRVPLALGAGVQNYTVDVSGSGLRVPCDGIMYVGVEGTGGTSTLAGPLLSGNSGQGPPQVGASCPGLHNGASFQGQTSGTLPNYGIRCSVIINTPQNGLLCPTDINRDEQTGIVDLLATLDDWGDCEVDNSGDGTTGIVDFLAILGNWGQCPIPTNDDAENAFILCVGTTEVVIPYSTSDTGNGDPATTDGPLEVELECGALGSTPRQDVWYVFTAPFTGKMNFSTCSLATDYDSILAVYTAAGGAPPTRDQLIACNDDGCVLAGGGGPSEVDVDVTIGAQYLVQVAGFGAEVGNGELIINGEASNINEDCESALDLPFDELIVVDFLQGSGALTDPGDETCVTPFLAPSLWWKFIGNNTTITIDPCFPAETDFYMDVQTAAFCGSSCNPVAQACLGGGNVTSPGECPTLIAGAFSFCTDLFAGNFIRVQAFPFNSAYLTEPTRNVAFMATDALDFGCAAPDCGIPPPANDNFENAITVECGTFAFNNLAATMDGVTHPACSTGGDGGITVNDIWYRFTTTEEHTLTISTCNDGDPSTGSADFDSDLVLYTDPGGTTPPGAGEFVACNDDTGGCAGFSSRITVVVPAGDYVLRVGGWSVPDPGNGTGDSGTGVIALLCDPPPPAPDPTDLPLDAPLVSGDATHFFNLPTSFADDGPDGLDLEPVCTDWSSWAPNSPQNDAWWEWEATATGSVTISMCASSSAGGADTRLAVWPGATNPPTDVSTVVACDDDGCGSSGFSSEVTFPVTSGETFLVEFGTWDAGQGGLIDIVITQS